MAVPLEQFVKQLEDSGIIASETLKDFIPPKANPKDAEDLARELVQKKKLTKFQAQEAYQGKAKALVLGNYTILDKIGQGGMGQVFKAQHRRMKRIVAVKMLPPTVTKDAAAAARFQREVEAASKLLHPNIVSAFDADEARGVHFLVMEYVEGRDLSALVKKDGPFPVSKAVNYILQAARGLEFAHGEGVIHRDIKPSNLLLDLKGTVKILDMGLARIEAGGDADTQAELTGTGMVMGTVDYMAPEQGVSTKTADARADIYSLGCSLHYLLIGKAVYGGETVTAKLLAHHHQPIPNLCRLRDEVPLQVDTVFQKMVAKKIEDRYQTMTEVVADLERCGVGREASSSGILSFGSDTDDGLLTFLKDIPVGTTHKTKATKAVKVAGQGGWKNKKPLLIGAGVLGVIGLLLGVIFMFRTKDGTLVVEVNQPDAVIQVLSDEGKVEISEPGGLMPISISVVPGKHRIRVEKDGFATIADNIDIESGGTLDIKARLVPKAKQVATQPNQPWNTPAFQAWVKATQALPAEKQIEAVSKKLMELNLGFDGKVMGKIDKGLVWRIEFPTDNLTDISPVRGLLGLLSLDCSGSAPEKGILADLSPLQGIKLTTLTCFWTKVADLSPLQGMPLTLLHCYRTKTSDLAPLRGMKLTNLNCGGTQVSDVSPLRGMPLKALACGITHVSDLSPLIGMPLTDLDCSSTQVSDLSPLLGMNLNDVLFTPKNITKGLDVIRQMKSLKSIGTIYGENLPPAEFWKRYDAGEFGKPATKKLAYLDPAFQQWVNATQALPAEKQVEAVSKKLVELNPRFDGRVMGTEGTGQPKIENGIVTELRFHTDSVTDISPVRALAGLNFFSCPGSAPGKGRLSNLSPLAGMKLSKINCARTQVSDLSPLQGMPLTILHCDHTQASDLSPLTRVLTLGRLTILSTKVTPAAIATLQKALPNCKIDWDDPGKPAAPAKLAYLDPAFQAWVKTTQALPAEKQIEAVSKKLMELNPGFDGKVTNSDGNRPPKIEKDVVTRLGFLCDSITDISPVRALAGLKVLRCEGSGSDNCQLSDLSPLQGMHLTRLDCGHSKVADLSPLRGMQLSLLSCGSTQVSDLSPLETMPLTYLACYNTPISDLSPLEGCQSLKIINITATRVPASSVAALQKALPSCKIEWPEKGHVYGQPSTTTKLAYLAPAFQKWVADTQKLPAEKQIEAVSKKLMELNPGFDGVVKPGIHNGAVYDIQFLPDNMTDISPVRALAKLNSLKCVGTVGAKTSTFADLSPLQGMKLTVLNCGGTQVSDLSPLRELPLTKLYCPYTPLSDLSPLTDISTLTEVKVQGTKVTPAQVAALQTALPNCKIEWDGRASASPAGEGANPKRTEPATSGSK